jgi:hypothetical protein
VRAALGVCMREGEREREREREKERERHTQPPPSRVEKLKK